jgi:ribonucleoside-diphosphate reductase alpha chain
VARIIFRGGSGSGVNLRACVPPRSSSKGGYASGPVSFMRGADASAGTIKSGGKTRRAAKMVVLDIDHLDIEEFIWQVQGGRQGASSRLRATTSLDSPDWASIRTVNANNSVRHRRVHGGGAV